MNRVDSPEALESLKASLELLPSPILLSASGSEEIWMNASFMRFIDLVPSGGIDSPDRIITAERRPFAVYQDGRRVPAGKLPSAVSATGENITALPLQMHLQSGRTIDVMVFAGPIRDESGRINGGIVTCFDVSAQERRSLERLRFLAEAGEALTNSMSVEAVVATLQGLLVPHLGTYCAIALFEEGGGPHEVFVHHLDPAALETAKALQLQHGIEPSMFEIAFRVARSGEALLIPDLAEHAARADFSAPYRAYLTGLIEQAGVATSLVVPMRFRGEPLGAIVVGDRRHRRFTTDDMRLLEDLARRAAGALESARSLQRHEESSKLLQRALLPSRLPALLDVQFDAVYAPGDDEELVGGDWYDAFDLPDGRVVLTIGDVTGRGLRAAVLMSKVRQSFSAFSYYERDPARLLDAADETLRRRHPDAIVTAIAGTVDRNDMTFTYATAGHPMPYMRRGAAVIALPGHGLPLGLREDDEASSVKVQLQAGDILLLYTDGLTESTHDIAAGEARVVEALRTLDGQNVSEYVQSFALPNGSPDDVALLAFRIGEDAGPKNDATLEFEFDARDVRMARESRMCVAAFLHEHGAPVEALPVAELVYGELISNVVRHAPGIVRVRVDWSGDHPLLSMTDYGTGYAQQSELPSDPFSESGRGLFIVDALTRRFEVRRAPHGGSDVRALLNISRAKAGPG